MLNKYVNITIDTSNNWIEEVKEGGKCINVSLKNILISVQSNKLMCIEI